MKPTRAILQRGLLSCELIERAYRGTLAEVVATYDVGDEQAYVVIVDGHRWLVIPGSASWRDWWHNIQAQVPWRWARQALLTAAAPSTQVPVEGDSGRLWALGFLSAARPMCEWVRSLQPAPDFACGHSRGAAVLQIIAWSRRNFLESHAIAAPRVRFGPPEPVYGLHTWVARDDTVTRIPLGASHVGEVHELGRIGRIGEEHRIRWWRQRFAQALGNAGSPA